MDKKHDLTVLLAEDSPEDAFFIKRALNKADFQGRLQHVIDGQEAIQYLEGVSNFSDRARYPLPDVVLTDIKMPRVGGFELMQWLRSQQDLSRIPIAVLTSSQLDEDREKARALGACAYMVKDILLNDQTQLLSTLNKCLSERASRAEA